MQTFFNLQASGPTVVIPGVAGKIITVLGLVAAANAPVNLTLADRAAAVQVEARDLGDDLLPVPFVTAPGDGFVLAADSATPISGIVQYSLR